MKDAVPMKGTQLILDEAGATEEVWLPPTEGPIEEPPSEETVRSRLIAIPRRSRSHPFVVAVARLLVFWAKYRWYRARGYGREAAREKAWWHAREAPCPLVSAFRGAIRAVG